jgi:signal transduction histidine kinase/CheY-like chemotaxis protein
VDPIAPAENSPQPEDQDNEESKQFSRITLLATVLFLTVGAIALVITQLFQSPVATGLAVVGGFVLFPLCLVAHRHALRGNLNRAVGLISIAFYVIAAAMIVVGERLYGVLVVASTIPVMVSLPFVSRRILQRLILVTIGMLVVGSVSALFPPVITPTVPDHVINYVQSFSTPLLVGVIMLALLQSAGKLQAAAQGMRKAISELQESEKNLEIKVDERTAEVQKAFREMSDLNELAGIVNATLDVDQVTDYIYNGLQSMFRFDQMGVFLLDHEDERLRLKLQAGEPFNDKANRILCDDGLPLVPGHSFVAVSVMENVSIFTGVTAEGAAEAGPGDQAIYRHNPMKSLLLCPMEIQKKVEGCIFFTALHENFELTEGEIKSIERYVTQLGTAIHNARLFSEAEVSRQEAEAANETKGTFLANMSHEIRTPMNAIVGLTGLCLETELDGKQTDYLTKVDAAANSLRAIIDDILDFSKLEAGKFEIEEIPFCLNDVLDNLATISMVRCQDKELELLFQRDPSVPNHLMGDPTRLGQILINLVGNAIKFTEHGQIIVEARGVETEDPGTGIRFSIRDSGIGMNDEQLGRLFQSFSQADVSISRQYGGTGLGLAISQQLCELMGGCIEVTSEPGVGSDFHFTVTFDEAESVADSTDRPEAPQGLRVLVVDDNEPSRDILNEYLESFGYAVEQAETGEQCLEVMAGSDPFDLVLLDWMMPGMTGLDVALAIRDMENPPKVILLSAWDMPSSEHRAQVDAFLAKPIKPSTLLDTIMEAWGIEVVRRSRKQLHGTGPEDLAAIRGARVLVVDDSDINLQIACELLEKIPLTLATASDGAEAVDKVLAGEFECVLMDIQMPGMDGYTATRAIREKISAEELPIVAMTANVMAEDRARTVEAGMNGHVGKPVDPRELYQILLDIIPAADYTGYLPAEGEVATSAEPEPEEALPDNLPGLDITQGLSRVGGNQKLYRQLLRDLVADYAQSPAQMREVLATGDNEGLGRLAHKVRGIANNLGASSLGLAAEAIEERVKASEEVGEDLIGQLESELAVVGNSLAGLEESADTAAPSGAASDIDVAQTFGALNVAVASFDPQASEHLEALLAADISEKAAGLLRSAAEMLDNFDFASAQPLLDEAAGECGV